MIGFQVIPEFLMRPAHCTSEPGDVRIETTDGQRCTTIRLIGRIRTEHLAELGAQLHAVGPDFELPQPAFANGVKRTKLRPRELYY